MIRTLALISLFVTCVFGIGEFCVEDHHCGPEEKCSTVSTARVPMKQCAGMPSLGPSCKSTADCKWWLGYVCRGVSVGAPDAGLRCQHVLGWPEL